MDGVVRKGLFSENVTFEQKPDLSEETDHPGAESPGQREQ